MKKILVLFLLFLSITLISCNGNNNDDFNSIFGEGLLAVEKDGLCGYINKNGEVIIDLKYYACGRFLDGEAIVNIGGSTQLIDSKGNEILDKAYSILLRDEISKSFIFEEHDTSGWGLLDKDGEIIFNPTFSTARVSTNGLFVVSTDDKRKNKYINGEGEELFDLEFQFAHAFANGYATVAKDDKYGLINTEGNLVIDYQYDSTDLYVDNYGNIIVREINDNNEMTTHLINIKNEKIISNAKTIIGRGPLYAVQFDIGMQIYDYEGNLFSEETFYDVISIFNRIIVSYIYPMGPQYVFLNEDGSINITITGKDTVNLIRTYFNEVEMYHMFVFGDGEGILYNEENIYNLEVDNVTMVLENEEFIGVKDNLYGIIDKNNNVLLNFEFDSLRLVNNEFYVFEKNGLMGLMDLDYNIVVDLEYDRIFDEVNIYIF